MSSCLKHSECPSGSCGPTNTCRFRLRPSDFCAQDLHCPMGFSCQRGRCGKGQVNNPCIYHSDCQLNQYCAQGACIERSGAGGACKVGQNCQDGLLCRQGLCKPRCLTGAGYCNTDEWCQARNFCHKSNSSPLDLRKIWIAAAVVFAAILLALIVFMVVKRRRHRENGPVYQSKMQPSSPVSFTNEVPIASAPPPVYTPPSVPFQLSNNEK